MFDHTSLIRFIEARFGVDEPNITPWRRAVCGDLTSAFDFASAVGAGDELTATLPNPGTYDISVHGPNGFYRHAAGSARTELQVEVRAEPSAGGLTVALVDGRGRPGRGADHTPVVVDVADAYGPARRITLNGAEVFAVETSRSGGWYDIALSTPSDASFSYVLAGRLESEGELTSDPQLAGAPYAQA
jgi:phospholipase C